MKQSMKTMDVQIEYAVQANDTGEYFTTSYDSGTLATAKLWKTYVGAEKLAKVWGSELRPRPTNKVVEVEVKIQTTRTVK